METKIFIKNVNDFSYEYKEAIYELLDDSHKKIVDLKKNRIVSYCMIYNYLKENNINKSLNDIEYSRNGKPLLNGFKFSISNKDDIYVLAVSSYDIGVDIERIIKYDKKIFKYFYTENEKKIVKNNEDFFKIFTLKESYIKMNDSYFDSFKSDDYNNYYNKTMIYKDYIISYVISKRKKI